MTTAQLGLEAVDTKPEPGDLTLWSVTTIIGALDKPALLYWSAEQAAIAAIDSENTWKGMLHDRGREEAVKWLRDARFRRPKDQLSSAALGTCFHSAAEEYGLSGVRPDVGWLENRVQQEFGGKAAAAHVTAEAAVVGLMLDQFDGWLQRFTPTYQATEVAVYHPEYGYAGQSDAFMSVGATRFLADYKTSRQALDGRGKPRTPYPEQVGLQLAAYANAKYAAVWRPRRTSKFRRRYYLLSEEEQLQAVPVPEVDAGLVLQVTPESCEAYPMRIDEEVHRAFLYVLEAFRWLQETSKTVMGDPLEETQ